MTARTISNRDEPKTYTETVHHVLHASPRYAQAISARCRDLLVLDQYDLMQEAELHTLQIKDQPLAYWLGSKRIKDYVKRELTYRRHNVITQIVLDENGEEFDYIENTPDPELSPEDQLIAAEENTARAAKLNFARACLTPQQKRVLQLLEDGLSKSQVAKEMGIAKCTVTFHLNQVQNTFARLGLQP